MQWHKFKYFASCAIHLVNFLDLQLRTSIASEKGGTSGLLYSGTIRSSLKSQFQNKELPSLAPSPTMHPGTQFTAQKLLMSKAQSRLAHRLASALFECYHIFVSRTPQSFLPLNNALELTSGTSQPTAITTCPCALSTPQDTS